MTSTYIARIGEGHKVLIEKSVLVKEGLAVGDYVEVTIRKTEKTPLSESGSPYSL